MGAIEVRRLRKRYGACEVLRGIDLEVAEGELVAVLGPNGAGKTTTIEILEGLTPRTGGEVRVLGVDPWKASAAFRERVGVVLQEGTVEPLLRVRELVDLHRGFYRHPLPRAELLELVGLTEQADQLVRTLSGGQQRRVDVALALAGDPDLVFLDEPTTGFDPVARRRFWDAVAQLRSLGKTIVLTTHYLDEAEALADRILVVAEGTVVAEGPPGSFGGRQEASSHISFALPAGVGVDELPLPVELAGRTCSLASRTPTRDLHLLTSWALDRGVELAGIHVAPPTLEELYLELVG